MKAIKENWKLVLIVIAGIVAVIFMCIFGIQGAQNKAFALEEQVNTADSDIKVQEKRRVDLVYNLADGNRHPAYYCQLSGRHENRNLVYPQSQ